MMPVRFRHSIRIAPGVRLNIGRRGPFRFRPPQHPPRPGHPVEHRQARPTHLTRRSPRAHHGQPQHQGDGQCARHRPQLGGHLGRAAAARSGVRRDKERAMRQRRLKKLTAGPLRRRRGECLGAGYPPRVVGVLYTGLALDTRGTSRLREHATVHPCDLS
jgi:hypothetical protein